MDTAIRTFRNCGCEFVGHPSAHHRWITTGWDPKDPLAYVAVIVTQFAAAPLASLLAARRAISIEPMTEMRHR